MNTSPMISFKIIPPDDMDLAVVQHSHKQFEPKRSIQEHFYTACRMGTPDDVLYTLTNKDLPEKADINHSKDYGFFMACMYANLPVVEFLLTSPKLDKHADHNSRHGAALKYCLLHGKLDVAKYLLTSPQLKTPFKIHTQKDNIFIELCKSERIESLIYIICDYQIKYTKNIENWLHCPEAHNFKYRDEVLHLFQKRQFRDSLEKTLSNEYASTKRTKI